MAGTALATARWCVGHGWPVHPLAAGRKTPVRNCEACRAAGHTYQGCPCLADGRGCHGFRAASLDPGHLERWWGGGSRLGVGVSCGPAGLVVLDIDAHTCALPGRDRLLPGVAVHAEVDLRGLANGFHTLAVLAALRGETSPEHDRSTLRVRTPSGGMHVWYRAQPGDRWQSSAGSGGGRALAWQVDVRAHGGYIVTPGHVTGAGTYTPVAGAREPRPLPSWIARELGRTGHLLAAPAHTPRPVPPRARQAVASAAGPGRHGRTLDSVLAAVAGCAAVSEGAGFSEKLNRAAYTAGGLVAAGVLSAAEAERALTDAASRARPGQQVRCAAIIRGGLSAGARRPLVPGFRR
ncbi:bifunctional DNA primase/polymerase [Streptacidiphilus carbonis]|uniref:bifunctional DNA primase/polymerase n=1 Tax=Streptacidiphilus carbonis TaxID=105422 RepID=UPI000A43709D|nr:bifunctional DNA primase/polymerase [Streptacidiphilus carbonis]